MTTRSASCPRCVVLSGAYHCVEARAAHGSAPTPLERVSQPAAIHPPKYSTKVEAERSGAATCWATSPPAGTVTETGAPAPSAVSPVSRAVTSWVPGLARKTVACQPSPPPCGQNQAPEGACPGVTGVGRGRSQTTEPQPDQHGDAPPS